MALCPLHHSFRLAMNSFTSSGFDRFTLLLLITLSILYRVSVVAWLYPFLSECSRNSKSLPFWTILIDCGVSLKGWCVGCNPPSVQMWHSTNRATHASW